mmetsp:Transcript_84707/g.152703  ORF Transcript_84707/g.152703 Transcript_84707/m.152703 type:complete len:240 (+) Transcript_84707:52-771(+)
MAWAPSPRTNGTRPEASSPSGTRLRNPGTQSLGRLLASARPNYGRSPSPQRPSAMAVRHVDQVDEKSILALSQMCTEELDTRMREKNALTKFLADVKRSKQTYETKIQRKKRDSDSVTVQTMDLDKKLQGINGSNRVTAAEVGGICTENEKLRVEVEAIKVDLVEANAAWERECEEIEGLKQAIYATRKELSNEAKHRDTVQQDLRVNRTAQTLMVNRLDDITRRNRILKTTVANTINY